MRHDRRREERQRQLKALGESIAELRKEQMLSQAELAERANISPSHVSRLEKGGKPSLDTLFDVAEGLGVEPRLILERAADIESQYE